MEKKKEQRKKQKKKEKERQGTQFSRDFLIFFFCQQKEPDGKKRATDINVAIFFRFEDWLDSLLLLDAF